METTVIIVVFILAFLIFSIGVFYRYIRPYYKAEISFREAMDLVELPVITLYNGDKKFNFLLDTGASLSVIDSNILDNFVHEKLNTVGTIYGMEGNRIDTSYVKATLNYKDVIYTEEFQVVDMSNAFNQIKSETGVTLSGILGSLFFKKYQYILDFESLTAYSKK